MSELNNLTQARRTVATRHADLRRPAGERLAPFCKRVFDLALALVGLVICAPLFAVIAVLIKLDTPGPVFFRQVRVGRHGRRFRMWKFRKMPDDLPAGGPSLTRRYDSRLTFIGRVLERTKLDELPQLLNVLVGDMSLVGPRPEVPRFVEHYPELWERVLSARPGVVGPAQLRFRNESEMYPGGCADMEAYYVKHILPAKLAIDVTYAERNHLASDVLLILQTVMITIGGIFTRQTLLNRRWQLVQAAIMSVLAVAATLATAYVLAPRFRLSPGVYPIALVIVARLIGIMVFKLPNSLATSVTADDLMRFCRCAAVTGLLGAVGMLAGGDRELIGLLLAMDTFLFLAFLVIHKLIAYDIFVCYRLGRSGELGRRLPVAALIAGPLCVAAASLAVNAASGHQTVRAAWLVPVLAAVAVRPCVLLFSPVRATRPLSRWMLTAWSRLVLGGLVGSLIIALLGLVFVGRIATHWEVMVIDLALYLIAMTACALWPIRQSQAPGVNAAAGRTAVEKLLLVGSGVELGAYLSVLTTLPQGRFEVVGAVVPRPGDRTNTVGCVPILGDLSHITEIARTLRVTRVISVGAPLEDMVLEALRSECSMGDGCINSVDLLAPIPAGWRWDASPPTEECAHLGTRQLTGHHDG